MTELRAKLTGEQIVESPYQAFEVVLTDDNRMMILHYASLGYNGIILDLDGTSAIDRLLAEMYRRKMND